MSFARALGIDAAASGLTAAACPYAGQRATPERLQAGSDRLRHRWMDGYETEMRRLIREREEKTRRRSSNDYVRIRLTQIAQERR